MDLHSFKKSLAADASPAGISVYLKALWADAKGDWETAHTLVQDINDTSAAWIHAYLHRKEGDAWNADYWYQRAGKKRPARSLDEEWDDIVLALLSDRSS